MDLQTTIAWSLLLGDESLSIKEDLLENLSDDNSHHGDTPDFTIPQLLQEVYYVDQLSLSKGYEPDESLILRDKAFDYLRTFHNLIKELIEKSVKQTTIDDVLDDKPYKELKVKKGFVFDRYVKKNLSEPFSFRNKAYKIFSLLPQKYKSQLSKYSRRDIIAFPNVFTKYWSNGLFAIVTMHNDIYTDDILSLKKKLQELNKSKKLQERYLEEESKGCFSKTEVIKNGKQEDILCFSGIKFKGVEAAIKAIVNSGHFLNPTGITKSDKVRYYICPAKYITHDEAEASKVKFSNRMFSCCERKTFAEYDWQGVTSYTMIVKYPPCELCQFPVWKHSKKYNGKVYHGIKHDHASLKKENDSIAKIIYKKIHKHDTHF